MIYLILLFIVWLFIMNEYKNGCKCDPWYKCKNCCPELYKKMAMKKKQLKKRWHWPFLRINFGGDKEYMCQHGIGHSKGKWPHGCDGCCSDPNFPRNKNK